MPVSQPGGSAVAAGFPSYIETFGTLNQWSGDVAAFGVSGNALVPTTGSGWKYIQRPGVPLCSARIDAKVTQGDGAVYLMLRYRDSANFLAIRQDPTNFQIQSCIAGSETSLAAVSSAVANGVVRWIRLIITKDTIKAYRYTTDPNASATVVSPAQTLTEVAIPSPWTGQAGTQGVAVFFSDLVSRVADLRVGPA